MPAPDDKTFARCGMAAVCWHDLAAARLRVPHVWQTVLFPAESLTARLRASTRLGLWLDRSLGALFLGLAAKLAALQR